MFVPSCHTSRQVLFTQPSITSLGCINQNSEMRSMFLYRMYYKSIKSGMFWSLHLSGLWLSGLRLSNVQNSFRNVQIECHLHAKLRWEGYPMLGFGKWVIGLPKCFVLAARHPRFASNQSPFCVCWSWFQTQCLKIRTRNTRFSFYHVARPAICWAGIVGWNW